MNTFFLLHYIAVCVCVCLYVLSERFRLYFSFISLIHTRFCPLSFFHALAFTLSFAHTCSRSCSYCDMQTFSYCMTFCTSAHTTTMACAFMKSQRAAKTDFGTERTHAYATQFASRYRSFASSFVLTHIHTHICNHWSVSPRNWNARTIEMRVFQRATNTVENFYATVRSVPTMNEVFLLFSRFSHSLALFLLLFLPHSLSNTK